MTCVSATACRAVPARVHGSAHNPPVDCTGPVRPFRRLERRTCRTGLHPTCRCRAPGVRQSLATYQPRRCPTTRAETAGRTGGRVARHLSTAWMPDRFVHQRSQDSPCIDDSLHQAVAVFLEVVTLPEPANRRIDARIGRPIGALQWIPGPPLLRKGLPVALLVGSDSANQVPARRKTSRVAIPFQSHIRIVPTLGPWGQPRPRRPNPRQARDFFEKRLNAIVGDSCSGLLTAASNAR